MIERWMECLNDNTREDYKIMALSYMQKSQLAATAGHHLSQHLNMRQERTKQSPSPPIINNNNNNANLFASLNAAAAAASFSLLSPQQQQILIQQTAQRAALMAATGMPVSLHSLTAAAANQTQLYRHHQNLFAGWVPPIASSPPSPLQQQHLSPIGPVSPALSGKSTASSKRSASSSNNNNNDNCNNNDIIDRQGSMKKRPAKMPRLDDSLTNRQETTTGSIDGSIISPLSPTSSLSPESNNKDLSKQKQFPCKICNRSFGYKHVLQNHERTHTGEKPFQCPECQKRFTRDHHLKTHMRLHTGEKPYFCQHCDKRFVQVANLRRHLRVHTGERPYACELCSNKYSDSNQLKGHLLSHKNDKSFNCDDCSMRFRRRHHLMNHKCNSASNDNLSGLLPNVLQQQNASYQSTDDNIDNIKYELNDDNHDLDIVKNVSNSMITTKTTSTNNRRTQQQPVKLGISINYNKTHEIQADLPEQTEPEDLSMTSVKKYSSSIGNDSLYSRSPLSDNNIDNYDDNNILLSNSPNNNIFSNNILKRECEL